MGKYFMNCMGAFKSQVVCPDGWYVCCSCIKYSLNYWTVPVALWIWEQLTECIHDDLSIRCDLREKTNPPEKVLLLTSCFTEAAAGAALTAPLRSPLHYLQPPWLWASTSPAMFPKAPKAVITQLCNKHGACMCVFAKELVHLTSGFVC